MARPHPRAAPRGNAGPSTAVGCEESAHSHAHGVGVLADGWTDRAPGLELRPANSGWPMLAFVLRRCLIAPRAPGTCDPQSWFRGWRPRSEKWESEAWVLKPRSGGPRSRATGSVLTVSTRRAQLASGRRPAPASPVRSDMVPSWAHRPQPRPWSLSLASPSSAAATQSPP